MKYTNQTYVDDDLKLRTTVTTTESEVPKAATYNWLPVVVYNWSLTDFEGHILACGHEMGNGKMSPNALKRFHELAVDLYDKR